MASSSETEPIVGYRGKFGRESAWQFFQRDDWYHQMFRVYGDPRTTERFWLVTPEPAIIAVVLYLVFVFVGPKLMASRPPMNLRPLIIIYNFVLVILSSYMCIEVFFILRKKNDQVTFLHVYHHSTMIINWWMASKYVPVGQSFFVGMINSFIHALMYVYYALAALGPHMQKYLWWKKYMTSLQLIQFILVISHTGYNKFVRPDCDYPFLYNSIVFYYTISMVVLFTHFYYRTYVIRQRSPKHGKISKSGNEDVQKHSSADNNNAINGGTGRSVEQLRHREVTAKQS